MPVGPDLFVQHGVNDTNITQSCLAGFLWGPGENTRLTNTTGCPKLSVKSQTTALPVATSAATISSVISSALASYTAAFSEDIPDVHTYCGRIPCPQMKYLHCSGMA